MAASIETYLTVPCSVKAPLVTAARSGVAGPTRLDDLNLANAGIFDPDQYSDYRPADKSASLTFKHFVMEAGFIARMTDLLQSGQRLLSGLYSYRSLSRALPQVQSQQQENRTEMYQKTHQVLRPEIEKMRAFMEFRDRAVTVTTEVLAGLIPDVRDRDFFPSGRFLECLARVLDMFVVMDAVKNIKGSMNNDFSMYKR
ncbi:hypothetical protein BDK51DRAFT_40698 [Blyttiomyces helicus]|uniref:CYRIA/CYRIB Rac1 binding domain-containing protein n=1 Tax=Blyttiomyces helicus TaxID=388810 RepID=A0A4P9WII1_9FUNG|nr:hypothetical protein BDK51DRAFT_40698 [Blyttiomyces helicus]|eukprot:RKO90366.1 hypothetical protein BDK51DRAFT_40698 [Blyttiomyces helicus]